MSNQHHMKEFPNCLLRLCAVGVTLSIYLAGMAGCTTVQTRTAGEEEAAFFREFAGKSGGSQTEEQLEQDAEQRVNEINALSALGEELGLCSQYTFDALQESWEHENEERARKKQAGEVFYGPETLSLDHYFQYYYSTLQADILTFLLDNRDQNLVAQAKQFYDENHDMFTRIASVRCTISENGTTQEYVFERDEFRGLGQSDPVLMDFLSEAEDGEEATLGYGEDARKVKRLGVTTELLDFGFHERTIVETYLTTQWIPAWMEEYLSAHKIVF